MKSKNYIKIDAISCKIDTLKDLIGVFSNANRIRVFRKKNNGVYDYSIYNIDSHETLSFKNGLMDVGLADELYDKDLIIHDIVLDNISFKTEDNHSFTIHFEAYRANIETKPIFLIDDCSIEYLYSELKESILKNPETGVHQLMFLINIIKLDYVLLEEKERMILHKRYKNYDVLTHDKIDFNHIDRNRIMDEGFEIKPFSVLELSKLLGAYRSNVPQNELKRFGITDKSKSEYRCIILSIDNINDFMNKLQLEKDYDKNNEIFEKYYDDFYIDTMYKHLFYLVFLHELGHLAFENYSHCDKELNERRANYFSAYSLSLMESDEIIPYIWYKTRYQPYEYQKPVLTINFDQQVIDAVKSYNSTTYSILKQSLDEIRFIDLRSLESDYKCLQNNIDLAEELISESLSSVQDVIDKLDDLERNYGFDISELESDVIDLESELKDGEHLIKIIIRETEEIYEVYQNCQIDFKKLAVKLREFEINVEDIYYNVIHLIEDEGEILDRISDIDSACTKYFEKVEGLLRV